LFLRNKIYLICCYSKICLFVHFDLICRYAKWVKVVYNQIKLVYFFFLHFFINQNIYLHSWEAKNVGLTCQWWWQITFQEGNLYNFIVCKCLTSFKFKDFKFWLFQAQNKDILIFFPRHLLFIVWFVLKKSLFNQALV